MYKRGFTLVELSIVLVIIGLLAGGVLAGSELIHAAKIKKQTKQFDEYSLAYHAFRLKYNCLPGDCPNGSQFFAGVVNGNNNSMVDNNASTYYDDGAVNWPASTEYQQFFVMLGEAGLISGRYAPTAGSPVIGQNVPALALNPNASFFVSDSQSFIVVGGGRNPLTTSYRRGNNWIWAVMCALPNTVVQSFDDNCGVFVGNDLRRIDEKLDDGLPLSGKLFGFGGYNSQNDCLNGSEYKGTHTTAQCQAAYQLD